MYFKTPFVSDEAALTRVNVAHKGHPGGTAYEEDDRLISRTEAERIIRSVQKMIPVRNGTHTVISIECWWRGELRWARNHAHVASDRRNVSVSVLRRVGSDEGRGTTTQTDEKSLQQAVLTAERVVALSNGSPLVPFSEGEPLLPSPETKIWSDVTFTAPHAARAQLARELIAGAKSKGFLSAGYIEVCGYERTGLDTRTPSPDSILYGRSTNAQCSMTVRHEKGTGSGWAGGSSYNWSAIDTSALAAIALEKCATSINPVAIEPGRYTVILEPQASATIVGGLVSSLQFRGAAEVGSGPFAHTFDSELGLWRTKLGMKVVDERITISHDPIGSELGILPTPGLQPATWIENGTLIALGYDREYSLAMLNENFPITVRSSFRMSGGSTSIDEMIRTTSRGLLVTRFSNSGTLDGKSLVMSGYTRDGLWLIERGKIAKAVKNFRFTESPLFMLNQIEQLGTPVPIFNPGNDPIPIVVPPIKARDFSFTAMTDAI